MIYSLLAVIKNDTPFGGSLAVYRGEVPEVPEVPSTSYGCRLGSKFSAISGLSLPVVTVSPGIGHIADDILHDACRSGFRQLRSARDLCLRRMDVDSDVIRVGGGRATLFSLRTGTSVSSILSCRIDVKCAYIPQLRRLSGSSASD